jgi:hypothetical protein
VTKKLHEVSMIADDGRANRVQQWLIEIEAPVDVTRLLRVEADDDRLAEGERAAAILTGSATPAGDGTVDGTEITSASGSVQTRASDVSGNGHGEAAPERNPLEASPVPSIGASKTAPEKCPGEDALGHLFASIDSLGIPRDTFERYAKKKYGAGWNVNASGIKRVLAEVEHFSNDRQAFLDEMETALDVFA